MKKAMQQKKDMRHRQSEERERWTYREGGKSRGAEFTTLYFLHNLQMGQII